VAGEIQILHAGHGEQIGDRVALAQSSAIGFN
jgi:hypothetical protein